MKNRELFMNKRVLFVEMYCPFCKLWLEFIERININMPPEKRIEVIDCTQWQSNGIPDHPLIQKYAPYIDGFPCLFFEGKKISGANSREECEAFLKSLCSGDLLTSTDMPPMFDYDCKYEKTFFGRRIRCQ